MEEKEVSDIANAVTRAISKLNADTADKDTKETPGPETFQCPDCGTEVKGGIAFCPGCGCELEWGE